MVQSKKCLVSEENRTQVEIKKKNYLITAENLKIQPNAHKMNLFMLQLTQGSS